MHSSSVENEELVRIAATQDFNSGHHENETDGLTGGGPTHTLFLSPHLLVNPYLDHQLVSFEGSVPRLLPSQNNTETKERNIHLFFQARFEIDPTEDSNLLICYGEVNSYRHFGGSEWLHLQDHFS